MTRQEHIQELLRQYKPKFGDQTAIDLSKSVGRMNELREKVRKHDTKVRALARAVDRKSADEKRLEEMESSIEHQLERLVGLSTNSQVVP